MSRRPLAALLALALALPAATTLAAESHEFASENGPVRVTTVAEGLEHPWGLAFLPDGRMLVTERPGRLRFVNADGTLSRPIAGVPRVQARGQGGLLDVVLHPKFAENGLVYLSFSEPGSGGAGTSVAKGRLEGETLTDVQVIFRQAPKVDTGFHYGSRLVFDREGKLYVSSGDRGMQDTAQDLTRGQGKLFKLNEDGTPVAGLPLAAREGTHPGVFSYGHRNIQGMALHPQTGLVWTHEHGPRGGDEINVPRAGRNYGWPVITYGINYNGSTIGDGLKGKGRHGAAAAPVDAVHRRLGFRVLHGRPFPGVEGQRLRRFAGADAPPAVGVGWRARGGYRGAPRRLERAHP
jgi:glucose/arabinose dehydrogenase